MLSSCATTKWTPKLGFDGLATKLCHDGLATKLCRQVCHQVCHRRQVRRRRDDLATVWERNFVLKPSPVTKFRRQTVVTKFRRQTVAKPSKPNFGVHFVVAHEDTIRNRLCNYFSVIIVNENLYFNQNSHVCLSSIVCITILCNVCRYLNHQWSKK